MNKYNNLSKILIVAITLFVIPSCKMTFLDETLKTSRGNEFFKTDEGILQLAAGGYYQVFTGTTNGEWYYCHTNYGTDEFKVGGDPSNSPWNNYDAVLSPGLATNGNLQGANFTLGCFIHRYWRRKFIDPKCYGQYFHFYCN
jgi:hypothetical protein